MIGQVSNSIKSSGFHKLATIVSWADFNVSEGDPNSPTFLYIRSTILMDKPKVGVKTNIF